MKKFLLASAFMLVAQTASAAVIGFEDLTNGTTVTNQYEGVTFSSVGGNVNLVTNQPGIGFGNNFICTGSSSINCTSETILTFVNLVKNLSFYQVGDNASGVVAKVDVFVSGLFSSTVDILGFNDFNTPNLVDLTSFTDVSSIRIYNITDPGGLGWDNFSFEDGPAPIPVPASLGLLFSAVLGLGALRRRRKPEF